MLGIDGGSISLQSKHDVASFQDVFCQPYYWQLYHLMDENPKMIIDCGANCGHFSILTAICCKTKFGKSISKYLLIEPNPYLIPIIRRNLTNGGIFQNSTIKQALLGNKNGFGAIFVNKNNYLGSGITENLKAEKITVPYLDIEEETNGLSIDVMKIDIEGGEFNFVKTNLKFFKQVKLLFIEIHQAPINIKLELISSLETMGLFEVVNPIKAGEFQLLILRRR